MYEVKSIDEGKTNSVTGWSIQLNSALKNASQVSIVLFVYMQYGNKSRHVRYMRGGHFILKINFNYCAIFLKMS